MKTRIQYAIFRLPVSLLLAMVLALVLASSTVFGAFGEGDFIWKESANVYVKYAEQDSGRFGANDHPVELDEAEVRAALSALQIDEGKRDREDENEDKVEPAKVVFTKKQSARLAKYLVAGLRQAQPDQDVVFALDRETPRPLGMKPDISYTAGRAFFKDNRLNIILGDFDKPAHQGYEKAYDPTGVGIVRYRFAHGTRGRSSSNFDGPLVPLNGVQAMQIDNDRRDDWLTIDLAATMYALTTQVQQRESAERAAKRQELLELLDERDRALIEQRRQQYAAPPPPQYAAPPPQQYAPPPPGYVPAPPGYVPAPVPAQAPVAGGAMHPIEERMTVLKRLKDRGLITEAEFDKKRKELIDEL